MPHPLTNLLPKLKKTSFITLITLLLLLFSLFNSALDLAYLLRGRSTTATILSTEDFYMGVSEKYQLTVTYQYADQNLLRTAHDRAAKTPDMHPSAIIPIDYIPNTHFSRLPQNREFFWPILLLLTLLWLLLLLILRLKIGPTFHLP